MNLLKIRTGPERPPLLFYIRIKDDFAPHRMPAPTDKVTLNPDTKDDDHVDSETLRPPVGV